MITHRYFSNLVSPKEFEVDPKDVVTTDTGRQIYPLGNGVVINFMHYNITPVSMYVCPHIVKNVAWSLGATASSPFSTFDSSAEDQKIYDAFIEYRPRGDTALNVNNHISDYQLTDIFKPFLTNEKSAYENMQILKTKKSFTYTNGYGIKCTSSLYLDTEYIPSFWTTNFARCPNLYELCVMFCESKNIYNLIGINFFREPKHWTKNSPVYVTITDDNRKYYSFLSSTVIGKAGNANVHYLTLMLNHYIPMDIDKMMLNDNISYGTQRSTKSECSYDLIDTAFHIFEIQFGNFIDPVFQKNWNRIVNEPSRPYGYNKTKPGRAKTAGLIGDNLIYFCGSTPQYAIDEF